MKIIKNEIKDKQLIMEASPDSDVWKKVIDKEINHHAKNVKVDGFRPGKAPKHEVMKRINMQEVLFHAANQMANDLLKVILDSSEYNDAKLDIYPTPTLDIVKISEDELVLKYTFVQFPKATVGDYKKMKIDIIVPNVSDEEVDAEIKRIMDKEKMYTKKDGPIAKGDLVIFDFEGYIDNKTFPGGSAKKYELEIGSNSFIPGFEDGMIGLNLNEEKDLHLSFPKDYHARDFAGKEVIFKVKVHEIKATTTPTLDDNFVKTLKFGEVDTVAKLKDYLKSNIFRFKTQDANEKNVMVVNKGLVAITKIDEIPQIILNEEAKKIRDQLNQRLKQMQMKLEDYARFTGKTMEDFEKEIVEQAKNNVIVYAAIDEISEKEKIQVSERDLDAKYEELAKMYHTEVSEIKKSINRELLSELLLNELTIQKIISYYLPK